MKTKNSGTIIFVIVALDYAIIAAEALIDFLTSSFVAGEE
jgi:hypothetical protein